MGDRHNNTKDDKMFKKSEKQGRSKTPIIDAMNNINIEEKKSSVNKVIEIHNAKEYEKFKKKYDRSVIFYGARWCHACTDIKDLYDRIANRYHKRVAMAHVDIDDAGLDFSAVPIFVALRNGEEIDGMEGANKKGLKELVKKAIICK